MAGGEKNSFSTPYFLVDEKKLVKNLEILKQVSDRTGCKILLAQKAFSMFYAYPLLRKYLAGTTASGLYEAKLGHENFGGETHVFSPAYREEEFEELLQYADDVVFNSPGQVRKYAKKAKLAGKSVGLRINPECSTQEGHAIYDPCASFSRLGTTLENFDEALLPLLDGLHFHTLCEQGADALEITLKAVEEKFGRYLSRMKWLNLGGGHHITREDYDVEALAEMVKRLNDTMVEGVEVLSYRKLPDDAENAMSIVAACDYTIVLRDDYENGLSMTAEEFYNGILDFIENGNLNIVKKTKKGEKEMDLKPLIYEAHRVVDGNGLFLQLSSGSAANVKPELVLEAYCKSLGKEYPQFAFRINREEVYADAGEHDFVTLESFGEEIGEHVG